MRSDLIETISGCKDLTNVIVLTFNIDLIFVETVLLRALRKCGHPSLTIFADAEEVSRTFDAQGRWLSSIGRRFRVVPVPMHRGYRFHPKAVLVSGPEEAELFVGSGNLTFGGFRQNDEVWTSFSSREDGTGPMTAFQDMLSACMRRSNATHGVRREINEAYDAATRSWAAEKAKADGLIWRVGEGPSLLDQMASVVGDRPISRVLICSPYYDERGVGLRGVADHWPRATIELLVQSGQTTLTRSAIDHARIQPKLLSVKSARPDGGDAFIHAKCYALFSENAVLLFAGSANCTAAALGQSDGNGNAEMLAFQQLDITAFEEQVRSELQVVDETPVVPHQVDDNEVDDTENARILVLSASYAGGVLTISFSAHPGTRVDTCWVDSSAVALAMPVLPASNIIIPLTQLPRSIRLEGVADGERVLSRNHWVDHEFALSATSRKRKVVGAFEHGISPPNWSFGSWIEVLRLVSDHLHYEPEAVHEPHNAGHDNGNAEEHVYSAADFFTDDYRLPNQRATRVVPHEDDRILGLQRLLLEYFGIETEDVPSQEQDSNGLTGEEPVDGPETPVPNVRQNPIGRRQHRELTEVEHKRACRIITNLIDRLTDEHFLQHRHQDLLANDLSIVAVLLIAGRNEGWLPTDLFFEWTHKVWTRLFFDHGPSRADNAAAAGWLERRSQQTVDLESFRRAVGTVSLSAALAMWAFTCPDVAPKPEKVRFALATRMAVARLPWLWNLHRIHEVAAEIDRIASRTGWLGHGTGTDWNDIVTCWDQMFGEGRALARLEDVLADRTVEGWRSDIKRGKIEAGTLLWQGPLGFCVVKLSSGYQPKDNGAVSVLPLRARQEAKLTASFVLPVRCLLRAVPIGVRRFTNEDAEFLKGFVERIEGLLR